LEQKSTKEQFYALSAEELRSAFTDDKEGHIFTDLKGELTLQIFKNHDYFKIENSKLKIPGVIDELDEDHISALSADQIRTAILNSPLYDIFCDTDGELYSFP
jgi:hypothetical protein